MQIFEIKKEIMYHCVYIFHDCINSYYEWNSLLKKIKISFILLKHIKKDFSIVKKPFFFIIKTDLIFLLSKNHLFYYHKIDLIFYKPKKIIFLVLKKLIWYLSNRKTLFYVINTNLNFYLQKPLFSSYYKTDLVFWHIKINFFTKQNRSDSFQKKRLHS